MKATTLKMFSPVFLWVVFFSIYTTSAAKFEQIQFVEQVKCNAASNYSDESCNLCMQPSNASRKEGKLKQMMPYFRSEREVSLVLVTESDVTKH